MNLPTTFTPGRYVLSWIGRSWARDPIELAQQLKSMRKGFEAAGHKPALILLMVADGEEDAAAERIRAALDEGDPA